MAKTEIRLPKITQLPSGAWTTQLMVDGVRHRITRDTKEETVAAAAAVKYKAATVKANERRGIKPLSQAAEEYIESRRDSLSPATLYAYEGYAKNCFRTVQKANVFSTTDEQWQTAVRQEAKGKSPKYISNVWGFYSAAITEATGRRPKVNLPQKEKNERPFLDPDQIKVFVAAVKGESIEIAALLALSSLRRSELKALKWEHIDIAKETIAVKSAMVYADGGMVLKKQTKTSASTRTVPMIPQLKEALQKAERKSEFVVPFNGSYLYERINYICEKNDLPLVGLHGLRHSFASLAYHLQIPEKIAQEIGGWADDGTMRKIYTHLAKKDIANRAKDFTNFFKQM